MGTFRSNLHSGRLIGGLCVLFYLIFCLSWTLLARLFLRAYYWSANAAVLGFPVGVTLLLHCTCCPTGVLKTLWPCRNAWHVFSEVYMFLSWILSLLLFILFSVMAAIKPTVNQDAVISAVIYAIAFLMMGASHVITSEAEKRCEGTYVPTTDLGDSGSIHRSTKRRCLRMTRRVLRIVLTCLIMLLLLIFFVVMIGSLYEVVALIRDWNYYRPNRYLVTVTVPPHLPAAFYFRCEGPPGGQTVLMEQGLMGMAMMAIEFIPRSLAKQGMRACVYDRRGIGWSDPMETDSISLVSKKQNSETNIVFLRALVERVNLSTPFILAGHSYGGWHITRFALAYPDQVEALVYIDSSRFTQTNDGSANSYTTLESMFRLLSNFIPTGFVRFAAESGLVNFYKEFSSYIDLTDLSRSMKTEVFASLLGGSFFSRGMVEKRFIFTGSPVNADHRASLLAARLPVLVIDVSDDWFPKPSNATAYYTFVQMSGATHTSIVYSKKWGSRVAEEIVKFVAKFA